MEKIYLFLFYFIIALVYTLMPTVTGAATAPAIDASKTTRQALFNNVPSPVKAGISFSFKCVATGDPTPSYEWTKDGQTIDAVSDSRLSLSVGTLTIKSLDHVKDDGIYQCIASNTNGRDVSSLLNLKVAVIGKFKSPCTQSSKVKTVNAIVGRPLLINCPSLTYTYPKFYFWAFSKGLQRAEELPLDRRRSILSNGSLYFSYVENDDITTINSKGGVRCMIASDGSEMQSCPYKIKKIQGTVQKFGPIFIQQISGSVTVTENSKYTFDCTAGGNPTPKMFWYKNDKLIPSETGIKITIDSVSRTQAGRYTCKATSNGKSINASTTLIVEYEPTWKAQLKDHTAYEGSSLILNCNADGSPAPGYQWFKSGQQMKGSNPQLNITIGGGRLTLKSLSQANAGTYQCAAVNNHRTIYTTSTITVLKIPTTAPTKPPTRSTKGPTSTIAKSSSKTFQTTTKVSKATSSGSQPRTNSKATVTVKSTLAPRPAKRNPNAGCSSISYCLSLILLLVSVTIRISL